MATKLALVQNGVQCVHVLRREGPPFSRWVFCFVLFCFFYLPLTFLRTGGNILGAAAAAAKSLQSCPTLCDPIDGSPPGSFVPGTPQARILEWVAISFSECICSSPHIRNREFLPFPTYGTELRVMMTGLQGYHAE